jgi:ATP-binding cassette subfamily B (MDR/TAP) protein 1
VALHTHPQRVEDVNFTTVGFKLITIVNVLGSCVLALVMGWKLTLVAIFGCLPPLFIVGYVKIRLELTTHARTTRMYLESARFATEAITAIRTVATPTLEEKVVKMYDERLVRTSPKFVKITITSEVLFGLCESLCLATLGLIFWYGVKLLSQGVYDVQTFLHRVRRRDLWRPSSRVPLRLYRE